MVQAKHQTTRGIPTLLTRRSFPIFITNPRVSDFGRNGKEILQSAWRVRCVMEEGKSGLQKVVLHYEGASAEIYLQGAHVTSFKTKDGLERLFLSEVYILSFAFMCKINRFAPYVFYRGPSSPREKRLGEVSHFCFHNFRMQGRFPNTDSQGMKSGPSNLTRPQPPSLLFTLRKYGCRYPSVLCHYVINESN